VIPFNGDPKEMNRGLYESLLEERLEGLVAEDPKAAKRLLTDNPESNPDLYEIGIGNPPQDYPSLILQSDQMRMWLNLVEWSSPGQSLSLEPSELPSLQEIVEAIPS
jgi:hypothetical protein